MQAVFDGEAVLELLLQHDSIRTHLPIACNLMCCSKALRAAVARHCPGRLSIDTGDDRWRTSPGFDPRWAAWLRKHAPLLRSLKLADTVLPIPAATEALAEAATAGALQLQSLECTNDEFEDHLALLEQLPPQHLTELVLGPDISPVYSFALSGALTRLTALRRLHVAHRKNTELPFLSLLTELTALHRGAFKNLAHLPPQLLELHVNDFSNPGSTAEDARRLCHLTQLTQLQELQLRAFCVAAWPAEELRQLSGLTALSLGSPMEHGTFDLPSAAAWPSLPLRRLELDKIGLSESVCQHLAQLQGLTSLVIRECRFLTATSAEQLVVALGKLSALQELALCGGARQQGQQLVQAAAGLKGLRRLDLHSFAEPALAQLSSITALSLLTGLALDDCGVDEQVVASTLPHLPGLQSLKLTCVLSLSDATLAVVAQQQQLTEVRLSHLGVSFAGLQQLSSLNRLRSLRFRARDARWSDLYWLTALVHLDELWVDGACLSDGDCQLVKRQMPWLRSCHLIEDRIW